MRKHKAPVCSGRIHEGSEGDPKRFPRHENGQYLEVGKVTVRTIQNQENVLNEGIARLGVSLRQTEDQLMRDVMQSTSASINCVGGTNGDLPTEISLSDCNFVVQQLRNNNAYSFFDGIPGDNKFGTQPIRDAYLGLCHTDVQTDLTNVQGFVQRWNYPSNVSCIEPEWGNVSNIRFMCSSVGSITPNASLLGQNVYNIFVVGREAVCTVDQDQYSSQFIYRPPILDGPLALNCTVGWKMATANKIQNTSWMYNLRATLSSAAA